MLWKSICLLALVAIVAGCRQVPKPESVGSSSFVFVTQPLPPPPKSEGEAVQPEERAQYREAQLREPAVTPTYPDRALKGGAGRAFVGVHVTVDVDGRVADVRPSMFVFSTPGPFAEDFREAVEAAVRQWRFIPARAEYYEIVTEQGVTFNRVTRSETLESEFDLSFVFTAAGTVEAAVGAEGQ